MKYSKMHLTFIAILAMTLILSACSTNQNKSSGNTPPPNQNTSSDEFEVNYPQKEISVTVASSAGGATDLLIRFFQPYLEKELGQSIIIINEAGAGGTIGTASFLSKPNDGYDILFSLPTSIVFRPLTTETPYTYDDLTAVSRLSSAPLLLIVSEDSPYQDASELLTFMQKNPNKFTYAQGGTGGISDIAMRKMLLSAEVEAKSVAFESTAEGYAAVMGGHVDSYIANLTDYTGKEGVRAILNLGSDLDNEALEGIPTCADMGLDCVTDTVSGFYFKKGVDPEIVKTFDEAVARMMSNPEVQEAAKEANIFLHYANAEDFQQYMLSFVESTKKGLEAIEAE